MRKRQQLHVLAALTWMVLIPGRTEAEEPRDCTAYVLTGKVTIDGRLDEQTWTDLPQHTGFFWKGAPETYATYQSTFQVGYDDTALYLSIRADEPRLKQHLENGRKKAPGKLSWKHQLFEVLLSPETPDGVQHYQFVLDLYGYKGVYQAQLEGKPYEFKKTKWAEADVSWETAVHTGSDSYTMEMKFPFRSLEAKPRAGREWRLHIGRSGTWTPPGSGLHWSITNWSAWNPTIKFWRNMPKHGRVEFAPESLMPGIAQKLTLKINEDYYAWLNTDQRLESLVAKTKGKPNLLEGIGNNNLSLNGGHFSWHLLKGTRSLSMPQTYLLEWKDPIEFNCNLVEWANPSVFAEVYGLEYWDGSEWKLAYRETEHKGLRSCHIFEKAKATRVRLTVAKHTPNRWFWMKVNNFGLFLVDDAAGGAGEEEK